VLDALQHDLPPDDDELIERGREVRNGKQGHADFGPGRSGRAVRDMAPSHARRQGGVGP
jgi:hypothetical protein